LAYRVLRTGGSCRDWLYHRGGILKNSQYDGERLTLGAVEDLLDEPHVHVAFLIEEEAAVDGEEVIEPVLGLCHCLDLVHVDSRFLNHEIVNLELQFAIGVSDLIFRLVLEVVRIADVTVNVYYASYAGLLEYRR